MSYRRSYGGTTIVEVGVVALFGLFLLLLCLALPLMFWNGWASTMSRYDITGTVNAPVAGKLKLAEGQGTEKFAVSLTDAQGSRLGGADLILNCASTQCSSLQPGHRVQLDCFTEWHFWSPDEEECRFARLLPSET